MILSERLKLEKEYYTWIRLNGLSYQQLEDRPAQVIIFLDARGLICDKGRIEKLERESEHWHQQTLKIASIAADLQKVLGG